MIAIAAMEIPKGAILSYGFSAGSILRVFRLSYEARLGDCTAEAPFDCAQDRLQARSKEFLIKKYSEICELCALWGIFLHMKPGRIQKIHMDALLGKGFSAIRKQLRHQSCLGMCFECMI